MIRPYLDIILAELESIEMTPREALYLVTIIQLVILLWWKIIEQSKAPGWAKWLVGTLSTLAMIVNVLAIIVYTMI